VSATLNALAQDSKQDPVWLAVNFFYGSSVGKYHSESDSNYIVSLCSCL